MSVDFRFSVHATKAGRWCVVVERCGTVFALLGSSVLLGSVSSDRGACVRIEVELS